MKKRYWMLLLSLLAGGVAISQETRLFSLLPSTSTGIDFQNKLIETENANIITYEYFYNGGGVAAGDFNNDGLTDLFFTANLAPNKLYINKGNFQFQDVTRQSGAGGKRGWKTGVSVADVNGDGWLDIYVCYSGDLEPDKRRNQLLINNGNMTFTDRAAEMGIADQGYTTHAAFFDYDRDGDLDLFVLNHNVKDLRNFDAAFVKKMVDPDAGDRLYRNDLVSNGTSTGKVVFTDVTAAAGIIANPLGYGLGVMVSDLNNDGWPDLYVSNDYVEEDYLYINNGNGTFSEKLKDQLGHISNFSMGSDIADINNDGWPDIYTLDMLPADNRRQKLLYAPDNYELYNNMLRNGFYHQLMRNMLQVNNGNGTFSETGQLSGVSNTDWSWSALFADLNNDGNKDLFVTNGYGRDMINRDFMKFYANERLKFLRGEPSERMFQMLQGIKSTPLQSFVFENKGDLTFRDCSNEWGFDAIGFSHGAAYADLDNDGDLDLVSNRMNEVAAIYRNNSAEQQKIGHYLELAFNVGGPNTKAIGARVQVFTPAGMIMQENYPVHGFQSSMQIPLHFGLPASTVDSVVIRWPGGQLQTLKDVKTNTRIELKEIKADRQFVLPATGKTVFRAVESKIPFRHQEDEANDFKTQPLMLNMLSYSGPQLARADINKDGLDDLYFCAAKGQQSLVLLQQRNGSFDVSPQKGLAEDAPAEDVDALFFDADKDGDQDLYVVSGGYAFAENDPVLQDRLYKNEKGSYVKAANALPAETVSGSCVRAADVDGDGDLDLFVGGRVIPGKYPEAPTSLLLFNDGTGTFRNATAEAAPGLLQAGMVTDAMWIDLNKDQKPELIVCGEWMALSVFENNNGKLIDATTKYFTGNLKGWWNKLASADLDGDGDMDLVAGNWGTNSQLQVNEQEPAVLYYDDFDKNGSIDPITCYYIRGKSYPMPTRDEMTDQIVSLRQRFPTYDSYADMLITDILSGEQLKAAKKLEANFFETVWFENKNGSFIRHHLPVQANYAPVYAIAIDDFDRDGHQDILLAGNIEQTRIKIGKIDANYGVLLAGDGKGGFTYRSQLLSGLNVKGCVRNISLLRNGNNEKFVVFTINNQSPVVYQY